jgi:hypothetical protein
MNRSAIACREPAGSVVAGCAGVEQDVKGYAKTGAACAQRGARLEVARRDVVQHDHVGGNILVAESRLPLESALDQYNARLDVFDQRPQIRDDRTMTDASIF